MSDCIFCKIIKGEIPSFKVYEDEYVFSFMDINPINTGHVLVIPKSHVPHFQDIEDNTYLKAMTAVKKIAKSLESLYNPQKVGLLVAGFDVDHAHFHVIPLNDAKDVTAQKILEGTLKQAPFDELEIEANKIKEQLG